MKFSLIIPVYNTADFLPDCLDSCLQQGAYKLNEDYEIICVNDGSTDRSAEILAAYEKLGVRVVTQTNGGLAVARNSGAEVATGTYIWFIDSDDFIRENVLETLAGFIDRHPCDCCSASFLRVGETDPRTGLFDKTGGGGKSVAYPLRNGTAAVNSPMYGCVSSPAIFWNATASASKSA